MNYTVEVGHVFRDDRLTFEQRCDSIAETIRISLWANYSVCGGKAGRLADRLGCAASPQEFEEIWKEILDLAESSRCLINTQA